MGRALVVAGLVAAMLAAPASVAAFPSAATLTIDGRGRAHGVGMCMGGAYGRALAGQGYLAIIKHYYTGATVGPSSRVPARLKVSLGSSSKLAVSGDVGGGAFGVRDDSGGSASVVAGQRAVVWRREGSWICDIQQGSTLVKRLSGGQPYTMTPEGDTILGVAGVGGLGAYTHYRGNIIAATYQGSLRAVNDVAMEDYLKGLGEEPETHPREALNVISVLARTYASYRFANPKYSGAPYQLVNTAENQVYSGYDREKVSPNLVAAVNRTKGQVALYGGTPILAAYHGTCGGHTEDNDLAWGGSKIPYLRGVWCNEQTHGKPYCRTYRGFAWKVRTTFGTMARKLGASGSILGFSNWVRGYNKSATGSSRVYSLKIRSTGGSRSKTGAAVQSAYSLMNNQFWFDLPPSISSLSAARSGSGSSTFRFRLSERARVTVTISRTNGTVLFKKTIGARSAGAASYVWNGRTNAGKRVPAGTYRLRVDAVDGRQNRNWATRLFGSGGGGGGAAEVSMVLSRSMFSPAPDSAVPTIAITCAIGAASDMSLAVKDSSGTARRTLIPLTRVPAGTRVEAWDGKDDSGTVVPDGQYRVVMTDKVGSQATQIVSAAVAVDTVRPVVTSMTAQPPSFSATTAPGTLLRFSTSETGTASIRVHPWEGVAASAISLRTMLRTAGASAPVEAAWDGKDDGGGRVAAGLYAIEVVVTDPAGNRSVAPVPTRLTDYISVTVTP